MGDQRFVHYPQILTAAGLDVATVAGWVDRTARGTFDPVGIGVHHTAGRDSLGQIVGRNLSQLFIPKSGQVVVVSARKSSHFGWGVRQVLDRTRAGLAPLGDARDVYGLIGGRGTIIGNGYYVGIEVENLGDGRDPYPMEQLDALIGTCAALCHHFGWSANRVVHHREWTSRKIDMSWRGPLREAVAARLVPAPSPPGLRVRNYEEDDVKTFLVPVGPLDSDGNGWRDVNPQFGRDPVIVAVSLHGPYPPADGYWYQRATPVVAAQSRGGRAVVTVEGGAPSSTVNVWLAVA